MDGFHDDQKAMMKIFELRYGTYAQKNFLGCSPSDMRLFPTPLVRGTNSTLTAPRTQMLWDWPCWFQVNPTPPRTHIRWKDYEHVGSYSSSQR